MNIAFNPIPIIPELILTGLILSYLVLHLCFVKTSENRLALWAIVGFCITVLPATIFCKQQSISFSNSFIQDGLSYYFKIFFAITSITIMVMGHQWLARLERAKTEFILLIMLATLGMFFLVSSYNFILLYVSLEFITISFYIMTSYHRRESISIEAGLKYLVLGALSSGFLIYGISFLYGLTGNTQFDIIRNFIDHEKYIPKGVLFALVLILTGLAFKVASVPFQFWVPDVYQGAPTPVSAFLSVASKAAGFAVMIRILFTLFPSAYTYWGPLLCILSAMTLFYGNLGAIPQKDIKRFLGYSSIGHAGFLLMGMSTGNILGLSAVLYYLAAYLFTNLSVFLIVILFFNANQSNTIQYYAGLSQRSPFLAASMLLGLMSLAGVPPLAGFFGKFMVLVAIVEKGYLWLAMIGIINIVISLYYYLAIVKKIYIDKPTSNLSISIPMIARITIIVNTIGILILGIFQGPLVKMIYRSIQSFL